MQKKLRTQVDLSTTFHPQIDGCHSSNEMTSFDVLYDRRCRSPIS
ncbi:hypothetical protein MTR67_023495 [Solanum verrucosum]|uniref:Uncharacterized protein n=1 Tax=Solanum verrucosum TaxID=315347 RepID=A0AAF0QWL3_SOLVR|nr:hypothetical protein MTR67_023495 [Solanum verrucosum]